MKKTLCFIIILSFIMTYISTSVNQVYAEIKKETPISVTIKEITTEETPAPLIGISEKEQAELDEEELIQLGNTKPPRQPINMEKISPLKERSKLYSETPDSLVPATPTANLNEKVSPLPNSMASSSDISRKKSSGVQKAEMKEKEFAPGIVLLRFEEPNPNTSLEELFPELHIEKTENQSLELYESVKGADFKEITIEGVLYTKQERLDILKKEIGTSYVIYLEEKSKESVLEAIQILKKNSNVESATPSYLIEPCATPNDYTNYNLWGMERIQADDAWNEYTGSTSVTVGILDSGIDHTHPDLAPNLNMNLAYNAQSESKSNTMDYYGHGTHVAGILGAKGNNAIGVTGVNWNVKMVPIKIAISNTDEHTRAEIQTNAIQYATDHNIPILNMSYGFYNNRSFFDAVRNYPGLLIICAGNAGDNGRGANIDNYAQYVEISKLDNVIIVANSDRGDSRTFDSNYSLNHVDIAAPGTDIYSTYPVSMGSYASMHGTSMATPHVTGVAALLKGKYPSMTTAQIKETILSSADFSPSLMSGVTGGRRLNAYNAIRRAGSAKHLVVRPNNNETMSAAVERSLGNRSASEITSIKLIGNASLSLGPGFGMVSAGYVAYNLEYVDMSEFEGTLEKFAFAYCSSLKSVWLPEKKKFTLPAYCFSGCFQLRRLMKDRSSYNDEANLTGLASGENGQISLQTQCFVSCSSLDNVILPNVSELRVGDGVFWNCTGLSTIQVQGRNMKMRDADLREFTSLPPNAFRNTRIQSVRLPKGVSVGDSCFRDCQNLRQIQFHPDQWITYLSSNAFYSTHPDCKAFVNQSVWRSQGIPQSDTTNMPMEVNAFYMEPIDDELMCETIDYYFNECEEDGISVVPADIKYVALHSPGAEMRTLDHTASAKVLPNLEAVFITEFTGTLSNHSFSECSKLTEVTLSDRVTKFSGQCFANCTRLKSVFLEGRPKIYNEADLSGIWGSVGLNTQAFSNCTSLTTVRLSSLRVGTYHAFDGCTNLTTLYRNGHTKEEGTADLIDISTFWYGFNFQNTAIRTVKLPENVDIPRQAFDRCSALSTIKFHSLQTQRVMIGMLAFDRCSQDCKAYMHPVLAADSGFVIPSVEWGDIPKIAY